MNENRFENSYPLSPMQQGMLLHSLHDREGGAYIQQMVCAIGAPVDVPLLADVWRQLSQRHAVLRTSFQWEGQGGDLIREIKQDVHRKPELPFVSEDWSSLPAVRQQERMDDFLESDRRRGFELTTAPLMRIAVFQLGESDYRMVWTFHHALLDGRSHYLLLREFFDTYDALREGRQLDLEQPRPFCDYVAWLGKQDLSKAARFWQDSLSGFINPTSFQVVAPRNGSRNAGLKAEQHSSSTIRLPEKLTTELRLRAQENEVTLNTLVQASWALLLSRYSGEDDVLFGTTRACRHWANGGAESMVGLFINTLPFRVKVRRGQQLTEWLKDLRAQHLTLRDYEHTPLMNIKDWSAVPRGSSLFNSVLVFEDYQLNNRWRTLGGNWTTIDFNLLERTNYPLTLAAYADSDLLLKLEYDQQQFDRETIGRMLEQLQTTLQGMAENLGQRVGELPLLAVSERRQLLVDWNRTTPCQIGKTLSELFEQQVEQTPEATALVFENERLSYRELNERANQLAHYLRQRGVGPDVLVSLCLERSLEMVVGMLGTLKAGGAYVALDPTYPAERIAFMLADADAKVLLTQECLRANLPAHDAEVIAIDNDWKTIASHGKGNPERSCVADNLAYVIYTSGSTGKPKGVLVTHGNVLRLFETTRASFQFNSDDVWTLFHSYAFDFSVWELWGALLHGGRLVVVPYWVSRSPEDFYRLLCAEKVTVLNQTPSAFRQLIQAESAIGKIATLEGEGPVAKPQVTTLRLVIFGGEALELSSLKDWWQRHGYEQPQLVNMYGITETTVHVTYRPLRQADMAESRSVIGVPLGDLQVYVLDAYQELAPIGVTGEMYVGGAGLGRGYLQRPELTAERFVPHRFSAEAGMRLYRTGDLGRHLPSGDIEYLGRSDRQVKVRGFRIELGEIESVLARHEDVYECVVIAQPSKTDGNTLIAYLVASDAARNADELRALLRQKLPEYMVPSAFIFLDRLPLTANGKLDHRALPAPNPDGNSETAEALRLFIAPRTSIEESLAVIWRSVLKRDQIACDDNFFDLGGNSLLATQVMSRVRDVFHLEFPVRCVFEYPKLEEFAHLISKTRQAESNDHTPVMTHLARAAVNLSEVRDGYNSSRADTTKPK